MTREDLLLEALRVIKDQWVKIKDLDNRLRAVTVELHRMDDTTNGLIGMMEDIVRWRDGKV